MTIENYHAVDNAAMRSLKVIVFFIVIVIVIVFVIVIVTHAPA